ncbi:MAG: hypothetical protein M1834_001568 [Cirrosporium novae-zelandiae]|nr:MAG: hypothetical protein M1834_004085 [Cirrosporium novae-zelandiae]KAI9735553.1 MAG: hypothetical protein M1834_001568 [Cirrosporium novae-zelandiae]
MSLQLITPGSIGQSLQNAMQEFQDSLTPDQNNELRKIKAVPDVGSVVTFTAQLDLANMKRRGPSIASRFHSFLQSVQQFTSISDTFISSHPNIGALVWGGVKLTMLKPGPKQVMNALCRSFEAEIEPFKAEIRGCSEKVKREISFAKAQAISLEQKAASSHRSTAISIFSRINKNIDDSSERRLQKDEWSSRARKQKLLDSLSDYDHCTAFKQARKKCHVGTAQWLVQTSRFDRWHKETGSAVFWCSGKIGSGKTILTANVISHLFLNPPGPEVCIVYFFPRFDEDASLQAETILRSIIRQSLENLDDATFPNDLESCLINITKSPITGIKDLQTLLQKRIAISRTFYIIIDALDECEKSEREIIFSILSSVIASPQSNAKVFLAGRESIDKEIKRWFTSRQHVSMGSPEAHSDIVTYTREVIDERLSTEDLVVGDIDLVENIQNALVQGAQGMFLWVAFQLDDICAQCCDEDIRKTLKTLPKDLKETFNRALLRILTRGHAQIAKQVFRWVAGAKRPLSLEELREAIAIEPGQPYSKPERLMNGVNRINAWCENLILIDEETEAVQFAHHTVKQFFLSGPPDTSPNDFHIQSSVADHEIGEICVTYLNFNDFKTQLTRRTKPNRSITPRAIVKTALGSGLESTIAASLLHPFMAKNSQKANKINPMKGLIGCSEASDGDSTNKLQLGYPFLKYASKYWLLHSTRFEEKYSTTWNQWKKLILSEHCLGQTPWTYKQFIQRDRNVGEWICDTQHKALLRFIESSDRPFSGKIKTGLMKSTAAEGNMALFEIFLEIGNVLTADTAIVLQEAAGRGDLKIVEKLLAANVDVNTATFDEHSRWTALQAAAAGGYLEIVEKLLAAKADVNAAATGSYGRTALQAVIETGNLEIVEKLLAAKADVNAAAGGNYGRTALQAAVETGNLEIVEKLLAAKADINAATTRNYERTALQAAVAEGYLEIVEKLLAAKADVNTIATGSYERTALQIAVETGNLEIVEKLLAAKADVNAVAGGNYKRTALQAAAAGGYLEIVEKLLVAKADVNAAATGNYGRTALQAAAAGGYLEIVEKLLAAKADVNAAATGFGGRTALQEAAERDHLEIVERLKAAGA